MNRISLFPALLLLLALHVSLVPSSEAQADSLKRALFALQNPKDATILHPQGPGTIRIHTPTVIDSVEKMLRGHDEVLGYRIQIYLGSAAEAKSTRSKFLTLGTGLPCNMVQNIPNYAARAGDFRTSLEAHKSLATVKLHYPAAFVVQDKINPPRFQKKTP